MSGKIKSLEEVKAKLYEVFNEAVERHGKYEDPTEPGGSKRYSSGYPANFKVKNRQAIGALGGAIAEVEKEIREAKRGAPIQKL